MPYDPENLFKKIIDGQIPCHKIFETEHALAILDAFPLADGHALLLPKYPCVDVLDMPPDVAASVLRELPRLAGLVKMATGADGVNIVQNSGAAAGQVVFHLHFHVVPRFDGDGLVKLAAGRKSMLTPEDAAPVLSRMKEPYAESLGAIDALMSELRTGAVVPPKPAALAPTPAASKNKAPAPAPAAKKEKAAPAPAPAAAGASGAPAQKQHSGEKKPKPEKKAGPPAPADRAIDVSFADIRVGKIVDAVPHPSSDKLYVETIDLGEAAPRQILSGLAQHMALEQVKGADVVCICNLKARKMGGVESNGMVLCASGAGTPARCRAGRLPHKGKLAFVAPPPGAKPGDRVTWEGFPGEAETPKQMDKKKAWEAIQPEFSTDGKGVACYKGVPFAVAGGVCSAPTVANGIIS